MGTVNKIDSSLPRRLFTLRVDDHGPSDFGWEGSTNCPHCGARGRYVHIFLCDDGATRGAMSGCVKLFPHMKTALSIMAQSAHDKIQEARDLKRELKLASWFKDVLDGIEDYESGVLSLGELEAIGTRQYQRREKWLRNRGYRR